MIPEGKEEEDREIIPRQQSESSGGHQESPQGVSPDRSRIGREKWVVEIMIRLYCRKKEKNASLCPECTALLHYAEARLDRCPFGEGKSSCQRCTVHCYKPAMRSRMREVMRFAGPRMILYAPGEALRHLFR